MSLLVLLSLVQVLTCARSASSMSTVLLHAQLRERGFRQRWEARLETERKLQNVYPKKGAILW